MNLKNGSNIWKHFQKRSDHPRYLGVRQGQIHFRVQKDERANVRNSFGPIFRVHDRIPPWDLCTARGMCLGIGAVIFKNSIFILRKSPKISYLLISWENF